MGVMWVGSPWPVEVAETAGGEEHQPGRSAFGIRRGEQQCASGREEFAALAQEQAWALQMLDNFDCGDEVEGLGAEGVRDGIGEGRVEVHGREGSGGAEGSGVEIDGVDTTIAARLKCGGPGARAGAAIEDRDFRPKLPGYEAQDGVMQAHQRALCELRFFE